MSNSAVPSAPVTLTLDGVQVTFDFEVTGPSHSPIWKGWCILDGKRYEKVGTTKKQILNNLQTQIRPALAQRNVRSNSPTRLNMDPSSYDGSSQVHPANLSGSSVPDISNTNHPFNSYFSRDYGKYDASTQTLVDNNICRARVENIVKNSPNVIKSLLERADQLEGILQTTDALVAETERFKQEQDEILQAKSRVIANLKNEQKQLEKENENLSQKLQEHEFILKVKDNQLDQQNERLKAFEAKESNIKDLEYKLSEVRKTVDRLEKDKERLTEQLKDKEDTISILIAKLTKAMDKVFASQSRDKK